MTCGQCSEVFTSPWLLLRHVHDAHAVLVCPSDELVTLPVSTTPPSQQPANGTADTVETDDNTGTTPPLPPTRHRQTLSLDDTAPTPTDVDIRSTSPRSDDLDWPATVTEQESLSSLLCPERPRTQSPVESTRLPSQKLKRYICRLILRLR